MNSKKINSSTEAAIIHKKSTQPVDASFRKSQKLEITKNWRTQRI